MKAQGAPRIAMVGLASENCTFSRERTTGEDFRLLYGEDLRGERYPFLEEESFAGAEFLPLMHGRALPGGMITQDAYRSLKSDVLKRLKASLPLAAVYLDTCTAPCTWRAWKTPRPISWAVSGCSRAGGVC